MALDLPDLTGKFILITGASSGIGAAAARQLANAGATILLHGRSPQKTEAIADTTSGKPYVADFARFDEVKRLAEEVKRDAAHLDVILHNAGALVARRTLTADGHELTFQTNHLAGFLLQRLLNDLVVGTPGSRVVITSSAANHGGHVDINDLDHRRGRYRPFYAYSTTKLENILFMRELSRRLSGTQTMVAAVHPGAVATSFARSTTFPGIFYRIPLKALYLLPAERGAEPLVALATMPNPETANGLYFDRFVPGGRMSPEALDGRLARDLWERSEAMTQSWID